MNGLFNMFQMPRPNYGGLLNDEDMKYARSQGLLNAAAGLLSMSGPSTTPTSVGQALGAGLQGFTQGQQGALDNALKIRLAQNQEPELMKIARAAGYTPGTPAFTKFINDKYAKSGRSDYYSPVQTADGIMSFDHRTGTLGRISADGKPIVGAANDPRLQGKIAGAKEYGKAVGESVANIGGKYDALESIREARTILDKGIYSGFYGDIKKSLAKAAPGVDSTKAANTEEFTAYIGNVVIPRLKEFGGNDSNEEMRYLQRIMGGDITMEEAALRKILESAERKIAEGIKRLRNNSTEIVPPAPTQQPNGPPVPNAPARKVVRTGTLNGRRVVQYDDGSVDYAD